MEMDTSTQITPALSKSPQRLMNAWLPYEFFWTEWTHSDNCNLSAAEIECVTKCVKLSPSSQPADLRIHHYNHLVRQLELGYPVFKEFVIVNFLMKIYAMARLYGYDKFMQTPLPELAIDERLKNCLSKFEGSTLRDVFTRCRAEDFSLPWVYALIVEFQIADKNFSKSTQRQLP